MYNQAMNSDAKGFRLAYRYSSSLSIDLWCK